MSEAKQVLDAFLFEDINNNQIFDEDTWAITWEGNNFVVLNRENGTLHHFKVKIKKHLWDSDQAIADQEWFE